MQNEEKVSITLSLKKKKYKNTKEKRKKGGTHRNLDFYNIFIIVQIAFSYFYSCGLVLQ